jgi:hypothetical protein
MNLWDGLLERKHAGLGGKKELLARDLHKHAYSLGKLVKEVLVFHAFFKQHAKPNP